MVKLYGQSSITLELTMNLDSAATPQRYREEAPKTQQSRPYSLFARSCCHWNWTLERNQSQQCAQERDEKQELAHSPPLLLLNPRWLWWCEEGNRRQESASCTGSEATGQQQGDGSKLQLEMTTEQKSIYWAYWCWRRGSTKWKRRGPARTARHSQNRPVSYDKNGLDQSSNSKNDC